MSQDLVELLRHVPPDLNPPSDLFHRVERQCRRRRQTRTAVSVAAVAGIALIVVPAVSVLSPDRAVAPGQSAAGGGPDATETQCPVAASEYVDSSGEELRETVVLVASDCSTTPLSAGSGNQYQPELSPDKSAVAYIEGGNGDGPTRLVVTTLAGGDVTDLDSSSDPLGSPTWSADGTTIAYWKDNGSGVPGIWTVPSTGGRPTPIAQGTTAQAQPAWSPDGTHLAFTRADPAGSQIVTVDVATRVEKVLSTGEGEFKLASWSPDGLKLLAVQEVENTNQGMLVVLDASTGAVLNRSPILGEPIVAASWNGSDIVAVAAGVSVNATDIIRTDPQFNVIDTMPANIGVPHVGWDAGKAAGS